MDLPETVKVLHDLDVTRLGGADQLRGRALQNLRDLPIESHDVIAQSNGESFDVVNGNSFFTASRVLLLDEIVYQVSGRHLTDNGALVAIPNRHQLAFHVIHDSRFVTVINPLIRFAVVAHSNAPGVISPYVYWWRGGSLIQLSDRDADGLRVNVKEEFHQLLERLTGDAAE